MSVICGRNQHQLFSFWVSFEHGVISSSVNEARWGSFSRSSNQYHGRGILFAGNSGAGKSTITRLWKGIEGVTSLSDDRIILRRTNAGYKIYGTPWHGDARVVSPQSVPLKRIFFLKHGSANHVVRLDPFDATVNLLTCSFSKFWDAAGMDQDLLFLSELAQAIPCYELNFTSRFQHRQLYSAFS